MMNTSFHGGAVLLYAFGALATPVAGGLRAPRVESHRVVLTWTPAALPCGEAAHYRVVRGRPGAPGTRSDLAEVRTAGRTFVFVDRAVAPDTALEYNVYVVDDAGHPGARATLALRTPAAGPPVNRLRMQAVPGIAGNAFIRWEGRLGSDVTAIEILRARDKAGPFEPRTALHDLSIRTYEEQELEPGQEYWYALQLLGSDGLRSPPGEPAGLRAPRPPDVYLSDLDWIEAVAGWGRVERDRRSGGREPLRLGGVVFEKGIGTHAESRLVCALKPEYARFVAVAGVCDSKTTGSSITAMVLIDERVAFESPVLYAGDAPVFVDVEITRGSRVITLVITDAGDGIAHDVAHWANAGFVLDSR